MGAYPVILADRIVATALGPDDILHRLSELVDDERALPKRKPFFGTLSTTRFVLRRTPRGSNFFLPEFVGEIRRSGSGAEIRLISRVSAANIVAILGALLFGAGWWMATEAVLLFLAVGVGTVLLWHLWFGPEAARGERILLDALEAR